MKERWQTRFEELRHRLVLTPEEKRVIAFVLLALVLGFIVKGYRDAHRPIPATGHNARSGAVGQSSPITSASPMKRERKPARKRTSPSSESATDGTKP